MEPTSLCQQEIRRVLFLVEFSGSATKLQPQIRLQAVVLAIRRDDELPGRHTLALTVIEATLWAQARGSPQTPSERSQGVGHC
jgi:hypothetical protein